MEKCKTIGEMLADYGIRGAVAYRVVDRTLKDLTKKGLVAKDGKITATPEEFADAVVSNVPKREIRRLAAERDEDGNTDSGQLSS